MEYEIIQCLDTGVSAYHAGKFNQHSIGIDICMHPHPKYQTKTLQFYPESSLVDNTFEVQETPEAVVQVFKHKYIVSNTFDDEVPFFYIFEDRLYSADGNLNWRLQLWQDIFMFAEQNNEIMFGQGFHVRPLVFNNFIYSGLDGLNENSHNYFLNIFIRGGIFGILLVLYFFYNMLKITKVKNYKDIKPGDKIDVSGPFGEFFVQETQREMCFVGGSNILLSPETFVGFSQATMLSPDGKCKTFDDCFKFICLWGKYINAF